MSGTAAYRSYAVEVPGRSPEPAGTSYGAAEGSESVIRRPMAERRQEKRRQKGSVEDLHVFTDEGSFFFSQACRAFTPTCTSKPHPEGTSLKAKGSKQPPRYLRPGKLRHLLNSSSAVRASNAFLRWPSEPPTTQAAGPIMLAQEAENLGSSGAQMSQASASSSPNEVEGSRVPVAPSDVHSRALVTIEEFRAEQGEQGGMGGPAPALGRTNRGPAPGGSPGLEAMEAGALSLPHQQLQPGQYGASPLYNPPPVNKRQRKHYALCSPFHLAPAASAFSPLGQALLTQRASPLVLHSPAVGLVTPPPSNLLNQMVLPSSAQSAAAPASLDELPFDVLVSTLWAVPPRD